MNQDQLTTIRWNAMQLPPSPYRDSIIREVTAMLGYSAFNRSTDPHTAGRRLAVVVGHNKSRQGAVSRSGLQEWSFNGEVATSLLSFMPEDAEGQLFYRRPNQGGYSKEIKEVYGRVNEWRPSLTLELHFNAGGGDYCCMLYHHNSETSKRIATGMSKSVASGLDIPNKGAVALGPRDRGYPSVAHCDSPMVLCEPFFGDSATHDAMIMELGPRGLARIYADALFS